MNINLKTLVLTTLAAVTVCMHGTAYAVSLQQQIEDLQDQIDNIELTPGPQGETGPAGPTGSAPTVQMVARGNPLAGNAGIVALNRSCNTVHPGSRMCTSAEVMNTPDAPYLPHNVLWVRPEIVGVTPTGEAIDASGISATAGELTCSGWISGTFGLAIINIGGFNILSCTSEFNIACCAPVD